MANKIQFKRGTKATLPALSAGEPGFCTDTKELFIGTSSGNVKVANQESLDAHTGDTVKHITAGERATWNNKLDAGSLPSSLPANGGNADTVDGLHATDFQGNKTYGNVTYSESIAANTTIAKSISIPSGKKYGQLTVTGNGSGSGSFITFGVNIDNAKNATSGYAHPQYGYIAGGGSVGSQTFLRMNSLRIEGNTIQFNFVNTSTSSNGGISCYIYWEVW